jgi:hypothetical protein
MGHAVCRSWVGCRFRGRLAKVRWICGSRPSRVGRLVGGSWSAGWRPTRDGWGVVLEKLVLDQGGQERVVLGIRDCRTSEERQASPAGSTRSSILG